MLLIKFKYNKNKDAEGVEITVLPLFFFLEVKAK